MRHMRPEDLDFFKENGYLVLNQLLSDGETARFLVPGSAGSGYRNRGRPLAGVPGETR